MKVIDFWNEARLWGPSIRTRLLDFSGGYTKPNGSKQSTCAQSHGQEMIKNDKYRPKAGWPKQIDGTLRER